MSKSSGEKYPDRGSCRLSLRFSPRAAVLVFVDTKLKIPCAAARASKGDDQLRNEMGCGE